MTPFPRSNRDSVLDRITRLVCNRVVLVSLASIAAALSLFLCCSGLSRSLWLDEAWVANSVTEPSLKGMFYYEPWLQTSPPIFLLLVRCTVMLFGLNALSLRAVPFLMGILAAIGVAYVLRRLLTPFYALLGWTLFLLSPVFLNYSATLKQYTSELAAAVGILIAAIHYFQRPTTWRFWLLAVGVAAGMALGYAVVFVVPGIVLVIAFTPVSPDSESFGPFVRSCILALSSGAVLAAEHILLIAPNSSPILYGFWVVPDQVSDDKIGPGVDLITILPVAYRILEQERFLAVAVTFLGLSGLVLAYLRLRSGERHWLQILTLCAVPCLLITASRALALYPPADRLSLFALPFVLLLLLGSLQLGAAFVTERFRFLDNLWAIALVGATVATLFSGFRRSPVEKLRTSTEEVESAVAFLHDHAGPDDTVWVHASMEEAFKAYAKVFEWSSPPARFGATGQPCCPRDLTSIRNSSEDAVRRDFANGLPGAGIGRVWLFATGRSIHWTLIGMDETPIMESILRERGCVQEPAPQFPRIYLSSFDCRGPAPH